MTDEELIAQVRERFDLTATGTLRLLVLYALSTAHPDLPDVELRARRAHVMSALEHSEIPMLEPQRGVRLDNVNWPEVLRSIRETDSAY